MKTTISYRAYTVSTDMYETLKESLRLNNHEKSLRFEQTREKSTTLTLTAPTDDLYTDWKT